MAETIAIQLAAPTISKTVGLGFTESYSYIKNKVESSKQLEYRCKRLYQDLQRLLAEKEDVEKEVQKHKEKVTTNTYSLWMNRVLETESAVCTLIKKYEDEKQRLSKWRIQKRSRLSEKMAQKLNEIGELIEKERPKDFLVDKPAEPVLEELDVPQIIGYPTLQTALENILAFLRNNRIKVIGVYGKKGVGKTTIIQNLNNSEEVAKLFDMVIFIRCSADQSEHELQQRIANRLMMDTEGNKKDFDEVARRLHKELQNKKYLLILDDVVGKINLKQLGIPNNTKGSKVVIVTPRPEGYKLNAVDRLIKVKELSPDEAWKMFRNIIYPVNPEIDHSAIKPIARLVCERCSCLPLLIHKIGSFFKLKESERSWQKGLKDLKPWPELENQGLKELYSFLTFCFDELKDEKKQKCFLYASLYPANSKVYTDYLVECWAAHGFLGHIKEKMRYQDARNEGEAILEDLINFSLLEKGEGMMYVRMDDCTRQLALHISSRYPECSVYVQSDEEFDEIPNLEAWKQASWISLIDKIQRDLPTNHNGSRILTLLLQKNPKLATIPQAFFENMSNLLVLDLYGTGIQELPSSVSNLTNLKGLYLNGCELLTCLPSEVGSLKQLEVLDIRCSGMIFIPIYIRCLTNLRCLRVRYTRSGEQCMDEDVQTDHDVISKLHKLEELIIEVKSYEQWFDDAEYVVQQVASLENLAVFKCCFPSSKILKIFLERSKSWRDNKQFTSFQFFVGCSNSKRPKSFQYFDNKITNYLKYCNGEQMEDQAINKLLPQTDVFELISHKDIRNLSEFIGTSGLNRIRGFVIERCNAISTIVSGDIDGNTINNGGTEYEGLLPNLEQLYLDNLLHLKCVFRGPFYPGTLSKLQSLTLKNCPLLKRIFFKVAIEDFSELRKLIIQDCKEIEALITLKDVTEGERHVLPKLEMLVLDNLPMFETICTSQQLAWPSLELLQIHECSGIKSLPFNVDNAANLRSIKGKQEWWNKLEWTSNEILERFQSMFVSSC